jgi:glucose 1-dehydrogenase
MIGSLPMRRWQHCEASRDAGHGNPPHRVEDAEVADADAVAAMIDRVVATWGRLDVLVNNAGIQSETPGDRFDDRALEHILSVNLLGAARCARAAIRHFVSRPGGGVIINTSSVHEIVPKPGFLAYSIAKGGLGNLTRTLALEFAAQGIRVNAVGPGATISIAPGPTIRTSAPRWTATFPWAEPPRPRRSRRSLHFWRRMRRPT